MRDSLRLVIAGGGTGGHVLPAVAVIQELQERGIALDPLWIGSRDGTEAKQAAELGIQFAAIPVGKLRRHFDPRAIRDTVRDAANIPLGVLQARKLVRWFKPDVVLSTGGYVSVPTVLAARNRFPILTHEQTTILGMATRINMRSANVLALSFDSTASLVKGSRCRTVVTGNPIRAGLFRGDAGQARDRFGFDTGDPVILVMGGARGAQFLNQRIQSILAALLSDALVVHQTGPNHANGDYARLVAYRETLPKEMRSRYAVTEFIGSELADVYALADMLVCRSGAGTVAEIAALGKAAILIPLPLSGGGEQVVNARALASRGGARVVMQDAATTQALLGEIRSLLADPGARARMGAAAKAVGRRDAAARLADELLALADRSTLATG